MIGYLCVNFLDSLSHLGLNRYRVVTDGQTDIQTDRQTYDALSTTWCREWKARRVNLEVKRSNVRVMMSLGLRSCSRTAAKYVGTRPTYCSSSRWADAIRGILGFRLFCTIAVVRVLCVQFMFNLTPTYASITCHTWNAHSCRHDKSTALKHFRRSSCNTRLQMFWTCKIIKKKNAEHFFRP